jgi:hypothetical protein
MSYDGCSRARLIRMPYILENTSGTSTLIFPSPAWELILIEDTTLLKDQGIYISDTWTGVPSPRFVGTWARRTEAHIALLYDTDETIWHRIQWSPNLDEGVLRTVLRLLEEPMRLCFSELGQCSKS